LVGRGSAWAAFEKRVITAINRHKTGHKGLFLDLFDMFCSWNKQQRYRLIPPASLKHMLKQKKSRLRINYGGKAVSCWLN
jgi:hypothetical protein